MRLTNAFPVILRFGFDYTYSVAEDSNSDPSAEFFAAVNRADTTGAALARFLTPANWDRPHVFNSALFYAKDNWGFNLIQRFATGLPYTPGTDIPRRTGISASGEVLTNSTRMTASFTLDFFCLQEFQVGRKHAQGQSERLQPA